VAHNLAAGVLLAVTMAMGGLIELLVRGRPDARGRTSPEWSFFVITSFTLVCVAGALVATLKQVAPLPGGVWWPAIVGIALMWVGIALRAWSIATLGRFFKLMIVIQEDHRVINRGPYRYVRHPAYLGIIVYTAGIALVASNWIALVVLLGGITVLFAVRIQVEERALVQALGSEYALYMQRTARLVPGIY